MRKCIFTAAVLAGLYIGLKEICGLITYGALAGAAKMTVRYVVVITVTALPFVLYDIFFGRKNKAPCIGKKHPLLEVFFLAQFVATVMSYIEAVLCIVLKIDTGNTSLSGMSAAEISVFVFFTVIVGPIAEEYVFRKSFISIFKAPVAAILVSSAFFSYVHGAGSLLYAFVMGLALAYIALSYGIRYSIFFHMLHNLVTLILAQLCDIGEKYAVAVFLVSNVFTAVTGIVALVFFVLRARGAIGEDDGKET